MATLPILGCYILCCWQGNLHSPDSEYYLFYANSLLETGNLTGPGGNPLVYWPPGYILMLIPHFFLDHYVFWFNLILLILHQVIWVKMAEKLMVKSQVQFMFAAIMGLNTLILMVSVYVWSELPFMVLLSYAVYQLIHYLESQIRTHLIYFTLLLFCALMVRNAGVFLLPGFALFGLWQLKGKTRWEYLATLIMAGSGNFIWNVHRIFILDNPEAIQSLLPELTIFRNLLLLVSELAYSFIPRQLPDWLAALIFLIALAVLVKFIVLKLTKSEKLILLIIGSYMIFWMVIPADSDNMSRFLAPTIPFVLLMIFQYLGNFLKKQGFKSLFYGISYYLIVFSLLRIIRNTITWSNII